MFQCLQCSRGLNTRNVSGGLASRCDHCDLEYLSIAHLMDRSNRTLVREFWEYVMSAKFPDARRCPRCEKQMSAVPLRHQGEIHPILGCQSCYLLILKGKTMQSFEAEKPSQIDREHRAETLLFPPDLEKIRSTFRAVGRSMENERWKIRIENAEGKNFLLQFTLMGLALSSVTLMLLSRAGNGAKWGALAAICTFIMGMRLQRPSTKSEARENSESMAGPRVTKEFSNSNGLAQTRSGGVTAKRAA